MNRRGFLQAAGASSLVSIASRGLSEVPALSVERESVAPSVKSLLDREIAGYMQHNHAPGMQFALTDLRGTEYIASYGQEDPRMGKALTTQRLFQIGSISKSMAAIAALQLVDEGKLDLHRPVLEYLPWLAWKTALGPVTLHHILTHSSGMPNGGALFFPRNRWVHWQRYAPGMRYFYSNMAFNVVGRLVEQCDGRTYQESLVERIFRPVGMTRSRSALGGPEWALQSTSYIPAEIDVPFHRFDALREAPSFHEDTSAGCVASTPGDMARYLRCLLRGGVTDSGARMLSEKGFAALTARHIDTDEWGPHAGYGYGIGVDEVGGDHVLLHTGGMVSFMSAIYLNLSRGVAAFASINAQQGYRPMPVVRFATQALISATAKTAMPDSIALPAAEKPDVTKQPASDSVVYPHFPGRYVNDDPWDGLLTVTEENGRLRLNRTLMEPAQDGSFYLLAEPGAPDRVAFDCVLQGKAQVLLVNGTEYHRYNLPTGI